MVTVQEQSIQQIYKELEKVKDPEIPVLSIIDLGIIPEVIEDSGKVTVKLTPTFAACPAIQVMKDDIVKTVKAMGYDQVEVVVDFERKWTSDLISEVGKEKLKNFGIAPPEKHHGEVTVEMTQESRCPHCNSDDTTLKTLFGSALCRSFHYCFSCSMTFERFKPIA